MLPVVVESVEASKRQPRDATSRHPTQSTWKRKTTLKPVEVTAEEMVSGSSSFERAAQIQRGLNETPQ